MHLGEFLQQSVVVLGAAVAVVFLSARLKLPSLVGLTLTGLVIGPSGLGLVESAEEVEVFAEIGVVLLLFIIGLELSVDRLKELGRPFLLGGGAQAVLTVAGAAVLALWWAPSRRAALFAGLVIALSSTAVVLKLYDQRRETRTPQGRAVLGILLFQDFLIVPMIVLTPVLAGTAEASPAELLARFAAALGAIAVVVLAARFGMPAILQALVRVKVRELFVLAGLLSCLALSWFTYSLGFSLALGAFLAGILVSETEYSHQVVADILPFRDVFASVFFISIGMLVDLPFALGRLPALLALTLALVALKAVAAGVAVRLLGYPLRIAVIAGLGLAQIGEFSFVLMEVGRVNGLLDGDGFQTLLAVAVLTLLATPLLIQAAPAVGRRLAGMKGPEPAPGEPGEGLSGHVVVVGYGAGGSLLCRVLGEAGIPFVAVDLDPEAVRRARAAGVPILYGDATRHDILERAGIEHARAVVFKISDLEATRRAVRLVHDLHPGIEIVVRTRAVQEIERLRQAGAQDVVAEEFEAAIEIFDLVLRRFHVPANVIRAQARVLRNEGYRMLRGRTGRVEVSESVIQALAEGTTDHYRIDRRSHAAGRSLRELDLRRATGGASVIAVVRGEQPFVNPSPDLTLEAGDYLVLVGSHPQIERAFELLGGAGAGPPPG